MLSLLCIPAGVGFCSLSFLPSPAVTLTNYTLFSNLTEYHLLLLSVYYLNKPQSHQFDCALKRQLRLINTRNLSLVAHRCGRISGYRGLNPGLGIQDPTRTCRCHLHDCIWEQNGLSRTFPLTKQPFVTTGMILLVIRSMFNLHICLSTNPDIQDPSTIALAYYCNK